MKVPSAAEVVPLSCALDILCQMCKLKESIAQPIYEHWLNRWQRLQRPSQRAYWAYMPWRVLMFRGTYKRKVCSS